MNTNTPTIKELAEQQYKNTSNLSGRPSPTMTDLQWQHKFRKMRSEITPSATRNLSPKYEREHWHFDEYGNKIYESKMQWQNYCSFCNDILRSIRTGGIDYCYFTYQISTLLKYEHNRLRTRYIQDGEYWEVWLNERNCLC